MNYNNSPEFRNAIPHYHPRMKYLEERYGPDFLKKLPLYKTCVLNGTYRRIVSMDVENMRAEVVDEHGMMCSVPVLDLDSFVL